MFEVGEMGEGVVEGAFTSCMQKETKKTERVGGRSDSDHSVCV